MPGEGVVWYEEMRLGKGIKERGRGTLELHRLGQHVQKPQKCSQHDRAAGTE